MSQVKWRKVDLHIHSNASHDCSMTPEQVVDKLIENNINVFSITDHNNVNNVDIFRDIIDNKKSEGFEIEFLPGIELRTDRGKDGVAIHLVIIFPEKFTRQEITDNFLSKDGIELTLTNLTNIGRDKMGDGTQEAFYNKGCEIAYVSFDKIISLADSLGLLVVAVHPKDRAGIEKELDYMNRTSDSFAQILIDSVNAIDIMELPKNIDKAKYNRKFYLNVYNNFFRSMPSIICSDAHSLDDIGKKFTYVKMDTLDFEGLRQIIYEPVNRIYLSEQGPPIPYYPYISKMLVKGGYYDSIEFHFSPELNCIIGGRGSGKSVIIDLLRFVFNKYDKENYNYLDRLYNLLKFGNSVEVSICYLGTKFSISRTCNLESKKTKGGELTYKDKSSTPDYQGLDIELYSQGNLKQVTKKANEQLRLIDEIGKHTNLLNDVAIMNDKLIYNAYLQLEKLNSIKLDVAKHIERDNFLRQIKEKEEILDDEVIKEFTIVQEDKKYYDLVINNISSLLNISKEHKETISEYINISFPEEKSELLEILQSKFICMGERIIDTEDKKISKLKEFIDDIKAIETSNNETSSKVLWIHYYKAKENKYLEYLRNKNLENLADETNQLKLLKDELLYIDNNITPRLTKRIEELRELQSDRMQLSEIYYYTLDVIKKNRAKTCELISSKRDDLRITISSRVDKKKFQRHIEDVVSGLNIKYKDATSNIVQHSTSVREFVADIRRQDIKHFERKYKLTTDAAGKILSRYGSELPTWDYQLDLISKDVFDLELINFEDIIDIEIKDINDDKFKKFSRFSPGQQCSYLLSILLDASDNPLIIDQPEDELDWNYLASFIDKLSFCKINEEGNGRQFIFVTHNQNITVLADSESILKVSNIPIKEDEGIPSGKIEAHGGIERKEVRESVLSLEGGRDAFLKRQNRYGL